MADDNSNQTSSESSSMRNKATAAMNGAKETAKGLGEIFTQATQGDIGSHIGNTNEGLKRAKEALVKANEGKVESEITNAKHIFDKFVEDRNGTFGRMNIVQRTVAQAGGNWGQAKGFEKGVRITGSVAGLGAIISGTKNIISPERDENGERKTSAWKQVGKIGLGVAAIYASVIAGGKNRAMGLS